MQYFSIQVSYLDLKAVFVETTDSSRGPAEMYSGWFLMSERLKFHPQIILSPLFSEYAPYEDPRYILDPDGPPQSRVFGRWLGHWMWCSSVNSSMDEFFKKCVLVGSHYRSGLKVFLVPTSSFVCFPPAIAWVPFPPFCLPVFCLGACWPWTETVSQSQLPEVLDGRYYVPAKRKRLR